MADPMAQNNQGPIIRETPVESTKSPNRLDTAADRAVSTGLGTASELRTAWTNRNNPEQKSDSWNTLASFAGASAMLTISINIVVDFLFLNFLSVLFWIAFPIQLLLIIGLLILEAPVFFAILQSKFSGDSATKLQELERKTKSFVGNDQTRGAGYILCCLIVDCLLRSFLWRFLPALICGVLRIYIHRAVNGNSDPPEPVHV